MSNIIPSVIIASAILAVGLIPKPQASTPVKAVLAELVEASEKKDASGDTQFSKIFKGISKSASEGFRSGLEGSQMESDKEKLKIRDSIEVSGYKIVAGSQKHTEKVIGVVKNTSDKPITGVQLNAVFKDKEGNLIDVSSSFSSVPGSLKPGDEVGFEIRRELGSYNEKEEVLNSKRAASVSLKVVEFRVIK